VLLYIATLNSYKTILIAGKIGVFFGDSFGGLNVIFSGLAFIAALLTLISTLRQYKEDKIRASADRQDSENAIKISALQSYIQSETNTENIGVAKLILKNLTEKIFYNEEYNEIMAPNLEIKQVKYEIHNVTNELQIRVNF
jgi:gas vesicle protein